MERHPLWYPAARPFCRPPTSIPIHHHPAGTLVELPRLGWGRGHGAASGAHEQWGSPEAALALLGLSDKRGGAHPGKEEPPISPVCQLDIILSSPSSSWGFMGLGGS